MLVLNDLLKGFRRFKIEDSVELWPYYEMFHATHKWPRFYQSPLSLATEGPFYWGTVADCLVIVKRAFIHNPILYLILPPMSKTGNVHAEMYVLQQFVYAGVGAYLSTEDMGIFDFDPGLRENKLEPVKGNAEFIYLAGDYATCGHRQRAVRNKAFRLFEDGIVQRYAFTQSITPDELWDMQQVVKSWMAYKSWRNTDALKRYERYNAAAAASKWGALATLWIDNDTPKATSIVESVSELSACLTMRFHTYIDEPASLPDYTRAIHDFDLRDMETMLGSEALLNLGAAGFAGKGLESNKRELRPVKELQIYHLRPKTKLTREMWTDTGAVLDL